MPLTIDQFTHQVSSSGLMTEDGLRAWFKSESFDQVPLDGEQLARELVKQKKLTKFQASQIYAGKGTSLVLGNYVILDKLGQGGMGMVLKAEHKVMKRLVAVKVISAAAMKSKDAVQRFHREVEAAAKLTHPNIVNAHDADEAKGTHFLVMEYVEGDDLYSLVKKGGTLSVNAALDAILQAARGLEYAHKRGVIHRDIKPANLVLDREGTVKILDMGLARIESNELGAKQAELTNTGAIMGTIDYMSPEQAVDTKHADARSDIYSLGCSLYYLLVGHAVYTADTMMKKLLAHREAPLPSLVADAASVRTDASSVGHALDAVFHKMIAKNASDRYQSMTEVIAALEQYRAGNAKTIAQSTDGDGGSSNELQRFLQEMTDDDPNLTIVEPVVAVATLPKRTRKSTTEPMAEETLNSAGGEAQTASRMGTLARPQAATGKSARPTRRAVAIGLASVLVLLAGVIIFVQTNRGTLRIEITDPQIEVAIQGTDIVVKVEGQKDIRLKPGEHTLHVKQGDLEFDTKSFTLKKGETVVVKVERIGRRVRAMSDKKLLGDIEEPKPKPVRITPPVSPDRREAAKKLLAMGCVLHGFVGEARNNGIVEVPEGDFRIDAIHGTETTIYRDEHAELFAQFPDLEVFEGGVFVMSAKGVQSLAKLRKLSRIWCNETRFDDQAVAQLAKLWSLTALHLDTKHLTPTGLAQIGKLVDLRELDLVGANFDDDSLQHLKPLRQLEVLGLRLTSVRGPGLRHLVETQSLKLIGLNWQKAGNEGFAAVSQFQQIVEINVAGVASITDAGLAHLKDMPRLSRFLLSESSITDRGLEHLKSLTALEYLDLYKTNISDAGLLHLSELPQLRELLLGDTRVTDAGLDALKNLPLTSIALNTPGITDQGLARLKDFRQLGNLGLRSSTKMTGAGLAHLRDVSTLRSLGLEGRGFVPETWEHLGQLGQIESVVVNGTNVTDQALAHLTGMKALQVLHANGTSIGDEGLVHLTGLKNLTLLELHGTQVTDQGLMQLRNLPKLREVGCNDSPGVTPAGVQALLNALPSLRGEVASPDRRIAEWVLKLGGSVTIRQNDNEQAIAKDGQLPQDNFDLIKADFEGNAEVNDENVGTLRDALRLRHLGLGYTSVSDNGLEWIGNLTQLESVNLWHSKITGKTVARMTPLSQLRELVLNSIPVGDDAFKGFSNTSKLERLLLSGAHLTDASTPLLSQFSNLSELELDGNSITAIGIEGLESLKHLHYLGLSGTSFQAAEIKAVAKIRALRNVSVSSLRIREKVLDPLESLDELRILGLPGASFEADSAASLRPLRTLRQLDLWRSNVRDADLAHVATLPVLEVLKLARTGISDKGLIHLEKIKTLRHVVLNETKVTKPGVEKLHEALPQCWIEWDGGVIEPQPAE